ncbi:DUF5684 domain-containing protein [Gleimia sp. 6138-11-ORH1]|uniref:DUF5684 domain-containing protein n=1 Tax=Gleimia sp. 6138-11-ORH1 TaxID=2973937 RepID=UPI002168690D|nr:DUF5684 domain-containing protein [Gleimia sp. 6138-11-ORH1]MCS4484047.1 DUF5684 domain-containing protein [Gleimia sp. 6138-11-ORH1]
MEAQELVTQGTNTYAGSGGAMFILIAIGLYMMFKKEGITPWYGIIPIFNIFRVAKMATGETILAVLTIFLFPFLWVYVSYRLAKGYGHGIGFAILTYFFFPVMALVYGFSDKRFNPNA